MAMGAKSKALAAIKREQLLPMGCSVAVGISGGADSVALLHILLSLREEFSLSHIAAVHINHGLRGEEAERDCRLVSDLCLKWGVPLHITKADVAAMAKKQKIGLEEAGRVLRYRTFNEVADSLSDCRIATAHTASDNAETVLLHLCRGSGIHGAGGIPAKRGRIVRPLIDCTRAEIEAYCKENALPYVFDSTNADETFARNRVRLQVMPALRKINQKAETAICRFAAQSRDLNSFMDDMAKQAEQTAFLGGGQYRREALCALPNPLLLFTLRRILGKTEERHLRLAAKALTEGGTVPLSATKRFSVAGNVAAVVHSTEKVPPFCYAVSFGKTYTVGSDIYRVMCLSREEYEQKLKNCKYMFENACDYDKINGALTLRQRLAGDAYHPAGRNCGKTLKKLFNEEKTPARDAVPILCDEAGIVLVAGFRCDERVQITPLTTTVLVLTKEEDVL